MSRAQWIPRDQQIRQCEQAEQLRRALDQPLVTRLAMTKQVLDDMKQDARPANESAPSFARARSPDPSPHHCTELESKPGSLRGQRGDLMKLMLATKDGLWLRSGHTQAAWRGFFTGYLRRVGSQARWSQGRPNYDREFRRQLAAAACEPGASVAKLARAVMRASSCLRPLPLANELREAAHDEHRQSQHKLEEQPKVHPHQQRIGASVAEMRNAALLALEVAHRRFQVDGSHAAPT